MTSHSDKIYLKVGDLSGWLNVNRSTIYRWVDNKHFPKPIVLGPEADQNSTTRWLRSEVEEWLANRPRDKAYAD
tara:strand:- start:285 stop:506 length:222 start_codon:yes stop_codon:yes gene_type:complete